ncbi:MAG: S46 family peptidase [Holophagaceae bacterium]
MHRTLRLSLVALMLVSGISAEEGMWTFDNIPVAKMKAKYGFAPDQAWLDHVRLSCVRFPGGSGSFVSSEGLVLTNHHVGRGSIQQVSTKGNDYIKNGFYAATQDQEIPVKGLELRTLMTMTNVTEEMNRVTVGRDDQSASKLRDEALANLAKTMSEKTGLDCQVVRLYQGGEFWIYGYKVHKDVRLVFAPEEQIAFFGGDPDNFTYPRHNTDFAIFRVYENGKPYRPNHFLNWSATGAQDGDLTFVLGHPGSTSRLLTVDQMKADANVFLPMTLKSYAGRLKALRAFGQTSSEAARKISTTVFSIENDQKRTIRYAETLRHAGTVQKLEAQEAALQAAVAQDPQLAYAKKAWTKITQAQNALNAMAKDLTYVNTRGSSLLSAVFTMARMASEVTKPNDQRATMFKDANLKATQARLAMPTANYDADLELVNFTRGLEEAQEELGANHPFVKKMLGDQSAAQVAKHALATTTLQQPEVRKALLEGGLPALKASQDPLVKMALILEPMSRGISKKADDLRAVINEQNTQIAKARFAVYGKNLYPDATFTLRLTYGPIEGYPANGTKIQPFTTIAGLYDRAWGWGDKAENGAWALPPSWKNAASKLDMTTPFNFVHSVDIIGGNSGSPVTNTKGELIGLIFDGNIESLPGKYVYDGTANRAVSVDTRVIIEALNKVYGASALANELQGKSGAVTPQVAGVGTTPSK